MKIYLVVEKGRGFHVRRVIASNTRGEARMILTGRFPGVDPHRYRFSEIGHGAKGVPRLIVA